MGLLGGLIKAGVATKILNEARKPHNQARAKRLFNKVTNRGGADRGGTNTSSTGTDARLKPDGPAATPRP